jgi:hypothetical protein
MDIAKIVDRARKILLTPKNEWPVIEAEKAGHAKVLLSWLLPLSLIPAVASLIGFGIIGYSVGTVHIASMNLGLRQALLQLASMLGGAYLTAFIINALAEKFASEKNLDQAFALIAYAYTPACLGGIFQLIPSLAFIGSLAGLYSLYLLFIGLPFLMKTPPEKNTSYFVVSLLCVIVVSIVFSVVLAAIFMPALY